MPNKRIEGAVWASSPHTGTLYFCKALELYRTCLIYTSSPFPSHLQSMSTHSLAQAPSLKHGVKKHETYLYKLPLHYLLVGMGIKIKGWLKDNKAGDFLFHQHSDNQSFWHPVSHCAIVLFFRLCDYSKFLLVHVGCYEKWQAMYDWKSNLIDRACIQKWGM